MVDLLSSAAFPLVNVDEVGLLGEPPAMAWLAAQMKKSLAVFPKLGQPRIIGRLRAAYEGAFHHRAHLIVVPRARFDDGLSVEAAVLTVKPATQNLVRGERGNH